MKCKYQEEKDIFDDNLGCFQRRAYCKKVDKPCQGTEGVCSLFEPLALPEKKEVKKVPEKKEEEKEEKKEDEKEEE